MTGAFDDGALPERWEALSRADAEALAPPADAKERVRLRMATTLGLAAGLGAAAGSAAGAGAASALPTAEGVLGGVTKALLVKKAVVLAIAAATAVTGGTAAYVHVRARQKEALAQALAARVRAAAGPPAPLPAPDVRAPASTLGAERVLLDEAQRAIAQGRLVDAQALLLQHGQAFPQGLLREEAEALSIRLLVRQGNLAEAARRAARFRTQHPRSIQQPGIDEALKGGRR